MTRFLYAVIVLGQPYSVTARMAGCIRAAPCPTERAELWAAEYRQPVPAAMRCRMRAAEAGMSYMAHMPEARMTTELLGAGDKRRRADMPEPWALSEPVGRERGTATDKRRKADMPEPQVLPEWAGDMSRRTGIRRKTDVPGNSRARTSQARQGVPVSARIPQRSRAARRR